MKTYTGGTRPSGDPAELPTARAIYRYHLATYRNFWKEWPPTDVKETFKLWARYDAHATIRDASK